MQHLSPGRLVVGSAILFLALGTPAFADVIDGDWCDDTGRHLFIRGSTIVTPGRTQMEGEYTRHSFRYVIPANEPSSGQDVSLQLLNETTMHWRIGTSGTPQVWRRCKPVTS